VYTQSTLACNQWLTVCTHTALVSQHSTLDLVSTVASIKFASSSFSAKKYLKKKSGGRKTRWCFIGHQIPYRTPSSFFLIAVFFRGALLRANSRYLPPPYSFYGGGYRYRHFWGLAGVRFLFYLNLYQNILMFTFKKTYFGTRPD
jgi:hypothetical protein